MPKWSTERSTALRPPRLVRNCCCGTFLPCRQSDMPSLACDRVLLNKPPWAMALARRAGRRRIGVPHWTDEDAGLPNHTIARGVDHGGWPRVVEQRAAVVQHRLRLYRQRDCDPARAGGRGARDPCRVAWVRGQPGRVCGWMRAKGCPGWRSGGSAVASGLHVDDLADGLACAVDRGRGGRFCRGGRRCRAAAVLVAIVVLDARNLGILGLALHLRGQGRTDGRHVHETPCGGGRREGLGSQPVKIVGGGEIFRGAGLVGGLRHTRVDASSLPRHRIAPCRGHSPQPAAAACPAASVDLYQAAQRRARLRMPCASRHHRGGASPRSWPVRVAARCRRER